MKTKYIIAVLIAVMLIITGCQEANVINVQGESEITVDPDQAEVWVGISILKLNAQAAQNEANKVINDIIDGLRYKGISEDDIETERLSLYEEKKWVSGRSTSAGWRATQTLKIKTTDLSKVGAIVDVAVNNGANQINNINFGLSKAKEAEYKLEALAKATENAREKAETIAASLGATLGKVKTVSESNYYYAPYVRTMEAKAGDAAIAEAALIMPSDVKITGRISLVYNIR